MRYTRVHRFNMCPVSRVPCQMQRCRYRSEIYDTYNFQALKMFQQFLYAFYFTPGLEIFIAKESFYKKICLSPIILFRRPTGSCIAVSPKSLLLEQSYTDNILQLLILVVTAGSIYLSAIQDRCVCVCE